MGNGISVGVNGWINLSAPRYGAIAPRRKCVTAVIGPAIRQGTTAKRCLPLAQCFRSFPVRSSFTPGNGRMGFGALDPERVTGRSGVRAPQRSTRSVIRFGNGRSGPGFRTRRLRSEQPRTRDPAHGRGKSVSIRLTPRYRGAAWAAPARDGRPWPPVFAGNLEFASLRRRRSK
jgi:hypothetical protein